MTSTNAFSPGARVRVFNGYREDGYPCFEGWAVIDSAVPGRDDTYVVRFDADQGTTGRRDTPTYTRAVYEGMQNEPIPPVFHALGCRCERCTAHTLESAATFYYVVRVNGDRTDTHAAETLEAALELARPDDGDRIDYGTVRAVDAGAARLMQPEWHPYVSGALGSVPYGPGVLDSGRTLASLTETELVVQAQQAWDACQGDDLRKLRAEGSRRGVRVVSFLLAALLSVPAFAAPPCKVNVNTATPAEMQLLARTGPALALRLASGRPYGRLEAVDAVKGVGPYWLAVNGPHVAFVGPTTCTAKVAAPKVSRVAAQ